MPLAGIGSRFIAILVDYLIWGAAFFLIIAHVAAIIISARRISSAGFRQTGQSASLFSSCSCCSGDTSRCLRPSATAARQASASPRFASSISPGAASTLLNPWPATWCASSTICRASTLWASSPSLSADGNQRLGDMVAGTLVVRDREIDSPHWSESQLAHHYRRRLFAPAADTSPMAAAAPAGCAAGSGAGQACRIRSRSAGRLLCAPARYGPCYARRACRTHRLGPLRQVGADDPAGYQRGNLSGSCRASVTGFGADELRQSEEQGARYIKILEASKNDLRVSPARSVAFFDGLDDLALSNTNRARLIPAKSDWDRRARTWQRASTKSFF